MEVAYAAISSECFYEECSLFALFVQKESLLLGSDFGFDLIFYR